VIVYDPHDWPSPAYRDSPLPDVMLFTLLRQALHYVWGISDPAPDPAGELTAEEREEVELYRRERGYV
jgi:hypothetical protein